MTKFNEDSRVKIPTILHLARLGYEYVSLKNAVWDSETNIFPAIFKQSIANINSGIETQDNLPEPDVLSTEIIDNLEAGLNSFREILGALGKAA